METNLTRTQAIDLLRQYNKEPFHLLHALTVEGMMRWYAESLGYGEDADFWAMAGLLHDVDFEVHPEEHCKAAIPILEEAGASPALIHAIICHGYGICIDVAPEHEMEKVLFAGDELTGLIGALARMLPEKNCQEMQLKSLKKKFRDLKFAAGCSRDVIRQGAEMLNWELDDLLQRTMDAMKATEAGVNAELESWLAQ